MHIGSRIASNRVSPYVLFQGLTSHLRMALQNLVAFPFRHTTPLKIPIFLHIVLIFDAFLIPSNCSYLDTCEFLCLHCATLGVSTPKDSVLVQHPYSFTLSACHKCISVVLFTSCSWIPPSQGPSVLGFARLTLRLRGFSLILDVLSRVSYVRGWATAPPRSSVPPRPEAFPSAVPSLMPVYVFWRFFCFGLCALCLSRQRRFVCLK